MAARGIAFLLFVMLAIAARAQEDHGHTPPPYDPEGALVAGEVVALDKAGRSITLKHGPINGLALPAATAQFQVLDAAALARLTPGDHVRFEAEILSGVLSVTRIERASHGAGR